MKSKLSPMSAEAGRYRIYALIALPIVLFNLIAIFGPQVLLNDDAHHYYGVLNHNFPYYYWRFGILMCLVTEWIAWNIMAVSPQLIRSIYVLFIIVPLSCFFFTLLQKKLGFSREAAYVSAVLPAILPAQHHIPAFINGSYVLTGLLLIILCFHTAFKYLDQPGHKNWKLAPLAVLLYVLATYSMDHAVFFFPLLVFAFIGYHPLNRKHLFLALSLFLPTLIKTTWMLLMPRGSTTTIVPTISTILDRARYYLSSMLPLPKSLREWNDFALIIFIVIVIAGFILYLRNRDLGLNPLKPFRHLSYRKYIFYIYGFLVLWIVCNIFTFIFLSPRPTPRARYAYIAAYGFDALLAISLYPILNKLFSRKKNVIYFVFFIIIITAGFSRYIELKARFDELNNNQSMIVENLKRFEFPLNSQIVIYLSSAKNFWGRWNQSSGHLKFMLKRNDIDGLIGSKGRINKFNFYDPFNKNARGSRRKHLMRGLDLHRPLFLFVEKNKTFKQYEYALQWKEEPGNPGWTILHIDKITGQALPLVSGVGLNEYHSTLETLKKKGIMQKDILWGGPPGKEELIRLRKESNPKPLQMGFYDYRFEFRYNEAQGFS